MGKLTDTQIRTAKAGTKLSDGGGLSLIVSKTGTKLWRYRYRIDGKENVFALGSYGRTDTDAQVYGLSAAREAHLTARALVNQGIHPAHDRAHKRDKARSARTSGGDNTFQVWSETWLAAKRPNWSESYYQQAKKYLERDVYPFVGATPIREINSADMLQVVKRVAELRGATRVAEMLRVWCSGVFRHAIANVACDTDPTEAIRGAIIQPATKHNRPLTREEIPKLLASIDAYGGRTETKTLVKLLLHLFPRYGELRQARWSEIDWEDKVWKVPAERMKSKKPHLMPLSDIPLILLRELHQVTGHGELIFPGNRSTRPIESSTVLMALRYMGYNDISPHCFRGTASTLLNELGYEPDHIERQLAHSPRDKVRAAYNQAQYLSQRREMMRGWSDFIASLCGENVVPIGSKSA